ncbi:hypothetical protein PoB_005623700 [Plakobranchus ocellatus]|uniref:Uncharacterized protein n=1 Tax=Plakobranchus ocellatus TaxID=259542 RepID=A0AAV4CET1_9GAST|nr:hypothetical protein PoB_005623700 [Plakobranchus ocellatus]
MTPRSRKLVIVQSDGVVKVFSYADTKVKMKVPCWCPRCSTSTDEGEGREEQQNDDRLTKNRFDGRSRTSSVTSSGSGSRGSRSGSESFGPLSPSSPVFHTPHLNGRMKKF